MSYEMELHQAHKERLARIASRSVEPKPVQKPPVVYAKPKITAEQQKAAAEAKMAAFRKREELKAQMWAARQRKLHEDIELSIKYPPIKKIVAAVARHTDVSVVDILSCRRLKAYVHARQLVCYLAKKLTLMSFPKIGRHLKRDHTTILSSVRLIDRNLARGDEDAMRLLASIEMLTDELIPREDETDTPAEACQLEAPVSGPQGLAQGA